VPAGRYGRDVADVAVTGGNPAFRVEVRDGGATTVHTVTVPPGMAEAMGWDHAEAAALVRASFEFLLEREPPTSILRRFSLDVIGDYFPEYRRVVGHRTPPG
jgi:hypothetical protein